MSYCKPSLVSIGLNNFISSHFRWPCLVLQGTLSLPVPLSSSSEQMQNSTSNAGADPNIYCEGGARAKERGIYYHGLGVATNYCA